MSHFFFFFFGRLPLVECYEDEDLGLDVGQDDGLLLLSGVLPQDVLLFMELRAS